MFSDYNVRKIINFIGQFYSQDESHLSIRFLDYILSENKKVRINQY